MEGGRGAFSGSSSHDLMNISLDFDGIMDQDMSSLSVDMDVFSTGIHDDACLDQHNIYSHCAMNGKGSMRPPPRPSALQRASSSQSHPRQRHHSISHPNTSLPQLPLSLQPSSLTPSWESIFAESVMAQSNAACSAIDACKDDDCVSVSCNSECAGSCPSQCGEEEHGQCCDDDNCAPPDLCLSQACEVPVVSCTKPACSISDNEAAAAAALTSFGDNNLMASPGLTEADFANMGLPAVPCSSLSLDGPLANMTSFTDQIWGIPPEFILANHIMQYHDPTHDASHPNCVADNPSSVVATCTLPKHAASDNISEAHHNHPLADTVCGFQVHDPQTFAQHIFQQHRPALMQHGSCLKKDSISMADMNNVGYYLHTSTITGNQLSASASPTTNLSMGASVSPTPVSLATPSPMDAQHYFIDINTSGKDIPMPSVNNQYTCRWVTASGEACGCICSGHKELQEHCKNEHLKEIKKDHAGFYCQWQGCTRSTTFSQRSKLERHMQVHTGFKPVECKICGAQLSAKQSLDQHMRTHTGEKPWVCSFPGCNQAFKQQSALTMHERTHTGSKPLSCDICGKKFGESSNLSKHRRIHNIRGSHVCEICGKDFHRLDQLRRHMGTNHKDRPEEVKKFLSRVKSGRISKTSTVSISAASSDGASDLTDEHVTIEMAF